MHRGPQPAHGGRGVHPVPDDIAHDQGHPGARQRDHVEPVTAHPRLRGQVAVGHVHGVLVGQHLGKQAALEGHGRRVLAGVAAGVVDGDGRPRAQLLREGQVLLVEGLRGVGPPEVGHAQDHAAGLEGHGDQRVEPVVEGLAGPGLVLGPPAHGRVQIGREHRVPGVQGRRHRGRRHDEPDEVADRLEGRVRADAGDGRPAHLGVGAADAGGLVAAQYGLQQLDRHEVREPGDGDIRQFLRGPHHVQRGADPHARVVQQLEPAACHLGPAGDRGELGGVAQGHHVPGGPARVGLRRPYVDREQPVAREVHVVRHGPARGEQLGGAGVQPQVGDGAFLGVGRQVQEPAGLVVGEDQPLVVADDEHALAHGVQDGLVVLVHPGHLGGAPPGAAGAAPPAPGRRSRPLCRCRPGR